MAFTKHKISNQAEWFDYTNEKGEIEGRLKIRGIRYQAYQTSYDKAVKLIQRDATNWLKVDSNELTVQQTIFAVAAYHLVADCEGFKVETEKGLEDFKFSPDAILDLIVSCDEMQATVLWAFIDEKAKEVQAKIDGYKAEVLGKSENSTSGQNTEVTSKPMTQPKNSKQSTKPSKSKKSSTSKSLNTI